MTKTPDIRANDRKTGRGPERSTARKTMHRGMIDRLSSRAIDVRLGTSVSMTVPCDRLVTDTTRYVPRVSDARQSVRRALAR